MAFSRLPSRCRKHKPCGYAELLQECLALWVRSGGGLYPDDDPPAPQPLRAVALVILPVIVSVVGAAIALIVRGYLLTAGR
jgi:hypothetical protein